MSAEWGKSTCPLGGGAGRKKLPAYSTVLMDDINAKTATILFISRACAKYVALLSGHCFATVSFFKVNTKVRTGIDKALSYKVIIFIIGSNR